MKAVITGMTHLTENKQQELGQSWLVAMHFAGVKVDGVRVEFKDEENK